MLSLPRKRGTSTRSRTRPQSLQAALNDHPPHYLKLSLGCRLAMYRESRGFTGAFGSVLLRADTRVPRTSARYFEFECTRARAFERIGFFLVAFLLSYI